ncbi:MAG: hypothetical protein Q9P14_01010 [candidate division KSB1 bacterium]|nr:hypothetical protein [candidate division KSB1 bacterium]MDQ7066382.1 hypothetical protein [candidate division KSB1 bacterium]
MLPLIFIDIEPKVFVWKNTSRGKAARVDLANEGCQIGHINAFYPLAVPVQ